MTCPICWEIWAAIKKKMKNEKSPTNCILPNRVDLQHFPTGVSASVSPKTSTHPLLGSRLLSSAWKHKTIQNCKHYLFLRNIDIDNRILKISISILIRSIWKYRYQVYFLKRNFEAKNWLQAFYYAYLFLPLFN